MNAADKHRHAIATAPKPKRYFKRGRQMPRTEERARAYAARGAIRKFVITMAVLFPK